MTKEAFIHLKIERPREEIGRQIKAVWDRIAKPLDGLGDFETIIAKIGAIQGTTQIEVSKKAVIVMCADNGIVEENISQAGQEVTALVAKSMAQGTASVCKMARRAGADVFPVDIGINQREEILGLYQKKLGYGTKNFLKEPAMSEKDALRAIEVGISMVEYCRSQGYGLIATGEMGIGNTTTSSAMTAALMGYEANEVVGKGAGLSEAGLYHKREVIGKALSKYALHRRETLKILSTFGGFDIAGLTGVYIGGAIHHIPIVMDGMISAVAALTAKRLVPGTLDYMIPSHKSKEPAMAMIMKELELHPVIDAKLALGEGTGAVMMFSLLDTALTVYDTRTNFEDIKVERYQRFS